MSDFDLSMAIHATDDGASAQLGNVNEGLGNVGASAEQSSAKLRENATATNAAAVARKAFNAVLAEGGTMAQAATAYEETLALAQAGVTREVLNSISAFARQATTVKRTGDVLDEHGKRLGNARIAQMEYMHIVRASGDAIAAGIPVTQVMSMEIGRLGQALSMSGGAASGFGKFMASGWGMALIAGATALGMLISKLMETEDATDKTAQRMSELVTAADNVGSAQGALGKIVDLVTGKFDNQNVVLREAIRLQAILAQQQAVKEARAARTALFGTMGKINTVGEGFSSITPGGTGLGQTPQNPRVVAGRAAYEKLVQSYAIGAKDPGQQLVNFRKSVEAMSSRGELPGLNVNDAVEQAVRLASSRQTFHTERDVQAVAEGRVPLPDYLKKDPPKHRQKKPRKGKDPQILEDFGENAADRIRQMTAAFGDTPPQIEKVTKATEELDKLMREVERRKPPNLKELEGDAARARVAIQEGLQKPFKDFIRDQQQALAVEHLTALGMDDQAEALTEVNRLQKQMGPLTVEQKDAVLAIVQARKAEERELDILHEKQQIQLDAVQTTREAVRGLFDLSGQGLLDFPKRLEAGFEKMLGDKLFSELFGKTFHELEDQVKGVTVVQDASFKMKEAIERANASIALLGNAANAAAGKLSGVKNDAGITSAQGSALDGVFGSFGGSDPLAAALGGGGDGEGQNIDVVATRPHTNAESIPTDPTGFFSYMMSKLIKELHILPDGFAKSLGGVLGKGLEGFMIGTAVGNTLFKGSKAGQIGSQIGGTLGAIGGSFLPIPFGKEIGAAVGSVLGGVVGKLFQGAPKQAGASIGVDKYGNVTVAAGHGNDAQSATAAKAEAQSTADALTNIVKQLGGSLNAAALGGVSLGFRSSDKNQPYRVDTTGQGRATGNGVLAFATQEEAVAKALELMIGKGAVGGVSAAVQKALQSFGGDVNRGLTEALSVQKVETLLQGLGGEFFTTFKTFEDQAKDRLRIAEQYGFDVVKLEKLNAEERAKVFNDAIKAKVGDLQALLTDMASGSLFEGTISEKRKAILAQIAPLKDKAAGGDADAASQLAALERSLLETSRSGFGTAGPEYASDYTNAQTDAQSIIDAVTKQARDAQDRATAQLTAAQTSVDLQNETNTLLSGVNGRLDTLISTVVASVTGGTFGGGVASTARSVEL